MKLWFCLIITVSLTVFLVESLHARAKNSSRDREKLQKLANKLEKSFTKEYKKFKTTGVPSRKYEKMLEHLKVTPTTFRRQEVEDLPSEKQDVTCLMCRAIANTFLDYRRVEKYGDEDMIQEAIDLCTSLNLQPENVCEGLIRMHMETILFIVDNRPNLTSKLICGVVLQASNCAATDPALDFIVEVDNPENNLDHSQVYASTSFESKQKPYRVLHLTDFHYDPKYKAGSNALCEEPTCCRGDEPDSPEEGAGYWGDFRNCDTPWEAIQDAMTHINRTHQPFDWIIFTGDIVDHGVWETTVQGNIDAMDRIYDLLYETFSDTVIYPALGNHEVHPVNVFAPSTVSKEPLSSQWLYDYSAEVWSGWLTNDTLPSIQRGGYYTTTIVPGLRLIALNNNDCYVYNWWNFYTIEGQAEQLQWFHDVLLQAEALNEKVQILAHIPPGEGSCMKVWSREYNRVVERFRHVIVAQFYGHTHFDEFNLAYSDKNLYDAVSVGWNGGSLTAYADVNPNYKIFEVDPTTFEIINFEVWGYNLTEANLTPERPPKWYRTYSFKEKYSLNDLSIRSMHELVNKFASNETLLHEYWRLKVKDGEPLLKVGCKRSCLTAALCEIVTKEIGDDRKCRQLTDELRLESK